MQIKEVSRIGSRVDRALGLVPGVKILGLRSGNKGGYRYSASALKAAVALYEGARVNVDHAPQEDRSRERSYRDRFGRLVNVRFVPQKGLFGDLKFNPHHELAEQFAWDVENDPAKLGMSHVARATLRRDSESGDVIVESIDHVKCVDVVADPATTASLFEGLGGGPRMRVKSKMKVKKRRARSRRREGQLNESMDSGVGMAVENDGPVGSREAVADMIKNFVMDESLDAEALAAKIKTALKLIDSEPVEDAESEQTAESRVDKRYKELDEKMRLIEKKQRVHTLCESMSFRPSQKQLRALLKVDKRREAVDLIESFQESRDKRGSRAPVKSSQRRPASRAGEGDLKSWAQNLLG